MKVSTWSLVLGWLLQYGPNWNWLCDRREILESCRATAASLYIPRRPENTVERKVSALVFPKAAAVAAQVTVECEVTGPLLAGTVIVTRENRSQSLYHFCLGPPFAHVSRRPEGCQEIRNLKDRNGWVQSWKFSHC